jgi:hypothetical protein
LFSDDGDLGPVPDGWPDDEPVRRPRRWVQVVAVVLVAAVVGGSIWFTVSAVRGASARTASSQVAYPSPDPAASKVPLGRPPALSADAAGPYAFAQQQSLSSAPVAWDPCRQIRYVVNPTGAPPGGAQLIVDAVARTSAATGLQFEDEGPTGERFSPDRQAYQPARYGDRWAPVLITWADGASVPELAGPVLGLGGATSASAPDGPLVYVSGVLALDSTDIAATMAQPDGADRARAIVQHELGHLVGMAHVGDPSELMFTEESPLQTDDWGSGDRVGLARLGRGSCFPEM